MAGEEAPGALEHVRVFVNTRDVEGGIDELDNPGALAKFLRGRGLVPHGTAATGSDLAVARELREALRALLVHNAGAPLAPEALHALDHIAADFKMKPRFSAHSVALDPEGSGARAGLGRLLAIVAHAMGDGTWPRLKACLRDSCRWAFYDHARNRTGRWCSMAVCGNRTKAERYRARHPRGE